MTVKSRRQWTEQEIEFLKCCLEENKYTITKISELIGRSRGSVDAKILALGLKKEKKQVQDGYKECTKCKSILPLTYFTKRSDSKNSYRSWCRSCRTFESNEYRIKRKQSAVKVVNIDVSEAGQKECNECGVTKPINEFYRNKNLKDGFENHCKICSKTRKKEHQLKRLRERGY